MLRRVMIGVSLALTALIVLCVLFVLPSHPVDREGSMRSKRWEGTLRVWVCQDVSSTLPSWLSSQIKTFEKANPGVHVRVRSVPRGTWLDSEAVYPDVIIFSEGMIDAPQDFLSPFAKTDGFIAEAMRAGKWMGEQYALPLSLGGYAVLINESIWPSGEPLKDPMPVAGLFEESVPAANGDVNEDSVTVAKKKQIRYALFIPRSGALTASLGWSDATTAARTLNLPEGFGTATPDAAYSAFVGGNVGSIVATVDQTRKFAAREASGKGFAYRVETPLDPFCDLITFVGRVHSGDSARDKVADLFVAGLVGSEAQAMLPSYGMIPSIVGANPSEATPILKTLYERYQSNLVAPNAFGWSQVKSSFLDQSLYALMNDTKVMRDTIESVR